MPSRQLPSIAYLRQCFREENGRLFWLARPREHFPSERGWKMFNTRFNGKEAGYLNQRTNGDKRWFIYLDGRMFLRYAIVWAMHRSGVWRLNLDHKNRDSIDDRIENLRPSNQTLNAGNQKRRSDNHSGFKGVGWNRQYQQWEARIRGYGVKKVLGYFDDPAEAHAAYMKAAKELFGDFAYEG